MKYRWLIGYLLTALLLLCAGIMARGAALPDTGTDSAIMQGLLIPEDNRSTLYNQLSVTHTGVEPDSVGKQGGKASHKAFRWIESGNYFLHRGMADSAVTLYLKAKNVFEKQSHGQGLMHSFNNLGVTYHKYQASDIALNQLKQALVLSRKAAVPAHEKATVFANLATVHHSKNQSRIAFQYVDSATQVMSGNHTPERRATVYANLAMFFTSVERFDKALIYLQKAGDLLDQKENGRMKAFVWNDLAAVYRNIYNYDKALNYYQRAFDIQKSIGDTIRMAFLNNSIGQIQLERKAYEEAGKHFSRAVLLNSKLSDEKGVLENIQSLSSTLLKQGKPLKARDTLHAYLPRAEALGDYALLSDFHRLLGLSYSLNNQYARALEHQSLTKTYTDSLHDKQQDFRTEFFTTRGKLKQRWHSLRVNNLQEHLERQEADRRVSYPAIGGIALLGGILVFWLVVRNKRMKKGFQQQLQEKNRKIKETQKQLEESSTDIEAKVNERTKELQREMEKYKKKDVDLKKALKDAEEANYLKNAFLSNMSHEIRTPLNGIIGFSSLLETELSLMENKELYEYAQGIQTSGERLLHLLNNIIDISRIEANDLQVSLQETNIQQIIEKSADLFKFKANEKGLKFNMKLEETPMVYADPTSLSKVVSDIIDNAVKYTEKGFVNITSGYVSDKMEVFVKIRDTGVGIDENYLPRVFEAFRQESLGYSRAYQGAGLGLPLAKRLLELMNGRIELNSKKDQGTNVIIYIPTKEKARDKGSQQQHPSSGKKPAPELIKPMNEITILLVEDDRMNRLVINKMLENDWNVVATEDGDQTLEEVGKAHKKGQIFDLMLFDINLPSPWDGIQLMHHLRKKYPEYKEVPFIAQTAYAMRTDRRRLLEEGFDEYISKPINQQRLLTMIYNFLSRK
ncbi:MAG: tetratricopeptide repeat protein [Bacteroidales bacterium]|nr:tetratricopeptide repeat protein [Bacteroidales bacterium]MCF8334702.1 tetratricopeptide repeat protein [Bacteroidales bacterium]